MNWIRRHFQRYRQRRPWAFCWRIAVEGTLVTLAACVVMSLFGVAERDIKLDVKTLLFVGVVVAPVFETLLLQAFPVWIARLCKAGFPAQVAASIIPFFLLHAFEGVATGVAAGLVAGFYLAFTYVHWREQGRWPAFWVTALSHAIHNGIIIPLAYALGEI